MFVTYVLLEASFYYCLITKYYYSGIIYSLGRNIQGHFQTQS